MAKRKASNAKKKIGKATTKKSAKKKVAKPKKNTLPDWEVLMWDDMDHWAGSRSVQRGRSYQRGGRIRELAVTEDGRLLATVLGTEQYYVAVKRIESGQYGKQWSEQDVLESTCTCPVGYNGCKHAVAVVAEYLNELASGNTLPVASSEDPRWNKINRVGTDEDEWNDEVDEEEWPYPQAMSLARKKDGSKSAQSDAKQKTTHRTKAEWDKLIHQNIESRDQGELAELVWSLVERFPELRQEFQERISLSEGDVDRLVAECHREIKNATAEPAWSNHWSGESSIPDFTSVKRRLERLLDMGHADAVVKLGKLFIESVTRQVGESDDEGETAMEAAPCMPIIFQAVKQSTLSDAEKILYTIDACLQDDYDILDDSASLVLDAKWKKSVWSEVADCLRKRLGYSKKSATSPQSKLSDRSYRRDRESHWLLMALENAGQNDQLLEVYEREARATGSYERLVRYLIEQKQYDQAEQWATEGIAQVHERWPGISSSLAQMLCDIARRRHKWDLVAAHFAWLFFDRPSLGGFEDLVKAATKAKCKTKVRTMALDFLETGKQPVTWCEVTKGKNKGNHEIVVLPDWPLPVPDYLLPMLRQNNRTRRGGGPHYSVLLDMAIDTKDSNKVLHWYDKLVAQKVATRSGYHCQRAYGDHNADRVAEAVAKSHPERALTIYRQAVEFHLPHADQNSYEAVGRYLALMRPIMSSLGQPNNWQKLITDIRDQYKRRPRFMEVLDHLENRTIISTQKR